MNFIVELTKYLMLLLVGLYTYYSFRVFVKRNKAYQDKAYRLMTWFLFVFHFTGYFTMYLQIRNDKLLILYFSQASMFFLAIHLYKIIYPGISGLLLRNMLMLLSVGFIILTRISFDKAVRHVIFSGLALGLGILVPLVIQRYNKIREYGWVYGIGGIGLLVLVLLIGVENYGAKSWLNVFNLFTIHPTEFVKILFVFSIASLFTKAKDIKMVLVVSVMAGAMVLTLVFQKDLGGALIFFVTYVFMLYVATQKPLYLLFGLSAASLAAWVAYRLYDHVKVRVVAWKNPFAYIDKEGYQISQSLFAIGTGGWFGLGLFQGLPTSIPVVDSDFIFSAISEELGGLFALCIILLYINCFISLIDVSLKNSDDFFRLLALGFSVMFGFQVFLSIGGVIKFIPSTGVTLPFISSGGSSIISTIIMFMVVQGIYQVSDSKK